MSAAITIESELERALFLPTSSILSVSRILGYLIVLSTDGSFVTDRPPENVVPDQAGGYSRLVCCSLDGIAIAVSRDCDCSTFGLFYDIGRRHGKGRATRSFAVVKSRLRSPRLASCSPSRVGLSLSVGSEVHGFRYAFGGRWYLNCPAESPQ